MEEIGDKSLTVALFDNFPIRRTWHNEEWYYSVVDIVGALSANPNPSRYWSDMKLKMKAKEGFVVDGYEKSYPSPSLASMDANKKPIVPIAKASSALYNRFLVQMLNHSSGG